MNRSMLALIAIVVTLLVNVSGVESIKAQEESFMIDPNTDDYHIRYKNVFGEIVEVTFIPATKIVPIVKSHFRLNKEGKIEYGYHLKNSDRARQNIVSLLILSVSRVAVDVPASQYGIIKLNAPAGWEGVALADDMSDKNNKNLNVSWTWDYRNLDRTEDGIKPGESQGRLAIHSSDLPGVTIVRLRGGGYQPKAFLTLVLILSLPLANSLTNCIRTTMSFVMPPPPKSQRATPSTRS